MLKKVAHIIPKEQAEKADTIFWLSKTPEERLSALQILREQYIRFFNKGSLYRESRKGIRRIYKIVKQTQG
ncbi:MAG TPA: hypothetical protein VJ202_06545 [Thermodesulfobacteriota bacterium]|nr:hypothetical protein [Thermodesulfobacteriota bacterium]